MTFHECRLQEHVTLPGNYSVRNLDDCPGQFKASDSRNQAAAYLSPVDKETKEPPKAYN